MDDTTLMPFGKHKGTRMIDVPPQDLLWIYEQDWCKGSLRAYIEDNLDALEAQAKKDKR